jgi:hypothetical protein
MHGSFGAAYWEDLSPRIKDYWKRRRAAEIDAIYAMPFPQQGTFHGEPVTVLGPVDQFPPYNTHPAMGKSRTSQMMASGSRGRFVALGEDLIVGGKALLTRPPYKYRSDSPFLRALEKGDRQQRRIDWEAGRIPPKRRRR